MLPLKEVEESGGGAKERKTGTMTHMEEAKRGETTAPPAPPNSKYSGRNGAVFSFLMPMFDDSETTTIFLEVSQSAASVATARWREGSDWRKAGGDASAGWHPWLELNP